MANHAKVGISSSGAVRGRSNVGLTNSAPKANSVRRRTGQTRYEDEWDKFVESVEAQLAEAHQVTIIFGKSPYYARANVVKRAVYSFVAYARRRLKPGPLEKTIDAIRVAHAGRSTLKPLRKMFKKHPYYWVLTGLLLDCPAAQLRKSDVTRFSLHLTYARRHRVPPEFLIGFFLQTGSLAEVYRRAQDQDRREQWFLDKANA